MILPGKPGSARGVSRKRITEEQADPRLMEAVERA